MKKIMNFFINNKFIKFIKNKWVPVGDLVFDPMFLIPSSLLFCSFYFHDDILSLNASFKTIIAIVNVIISGFIGSTLRLKWNKYFEKSSLEAKGVSSIRSLMLSQGNIRALLERSRLFLERLPKSISKHHRDILVTNFEEICSRSEGLIKETMSSIENWNDIVPYGQPVNQASIFQTQLDQVVIEKNTMIDELNIMMKNEKKRYIKEKENLLNQINLKETKINELSNKISELKKQSGPLMSSTGFTTSGSLSHVWNNDTLGSLSANSINSWSVIDNPAHAASTAVNPISFGSNLANPANSRSYIDGVYNYHCNNCGQDFTLADAKRPVFPVKEVQHSCIYCNSKNTTLL